MLKIFETHPVQYHAPVYRAAAQDFGVPLKVFYGADFSVRGYQDQEFGAAVKWDVDLTSGYAHEFLSDTLTLKPKNYGEVTGYGVRQALRAAPTTAVMALGYNSVFDRAVWRAQLGSGVPLFLRAEANDSAQARSKLKATLRDSALYLLYQRVSSALYIGQQAKAHYLRLGIKAARLEFSPYCVDVGEVNIASIDKARAKVRAELSLSNNDQLALFSGKLSIRKGMREWLAACQRLPESARQRLVLGFVGAGELEQELRAGLAIPGAPRAHFFGFKNQSEISAIYAASDFGVLPSISGETWGLVVNESLHHGRPVLVSERIGSAADLILNGVTGWQVEPTPDALMQACLRMMQLAQDPATFARCQSQVSNYSIQAAAAGIARAYARCKEKKESLKTSISLANSTALLTTANTDRAQTDFAALGPICVAGVFSGTGVAGSLAWALRQQGLSCTEVDYRSAFRKGIRQSLQYRWNRQPLDLERFSQSLRMHCMEHGVRLLICTGIFPMRASVAEQLRDAGVKIVNFLTDDPWNPGFSNRYFLPGLAFHHTVFTPRHANFAQLQQAGAPRVEYLPFGYDERFFHPDPTQQEGALDLLFVGGCDADRAQLLKPIAQAHLNLALYGGFWDRYPHFRPYAQGLTDPQTLFAQTLAAKVCLILVRRANRDGHVMRSFEAAACGGCLLVEHTADHEEIFGADGESVRYFWRDDEILPKLKELLSDAPLRARLRQAVLGRMQGQSYQARVERMLRAL
jgi:glycosyltransferase involved in cell wall biosynthesis